MRRYAQLTRLAPEQEAEYIRHHERVWPDVLQAIAECAIENYSIFLSNGLLFSYFEYHGSDYEADVRKMAASPAMQRWWKMMDPTLASMPDAKPGQLWSPMREVFHFEGGEVQVATEASAQAES